MITLPESAGAPERALASPVLSSWGREHKWRTANNDPSLPFLSGASSGCISGLFWNSMPGPRHRRRQGKRRWERHSSPQRQPATSMSAPQPLKEDTTFPSFLQQVFTEHQLCARHHAGCWVIVKPKMHKIPALKEPAIRSRTGGGWGRDDK